MRLVLPRISEFSQSYALQPSRMRWSSGVRGCGFLRCIGTAEPEPVGLVHPKECPRIPVINSLLRDVAQFVAYYDRLEHARYRTDRIDFVGPDLQHGVPDARLVRLRGRTEPILE